MTMTRRSRRLVLICAVLTGVTIAAALTLYALRRNVTYFLSPTDIAMTSARPLAGGRDIRMGGLVVYGSVERDGTITKFVVTDIQNDIPVEYDGIVPDLFREGQGVIAIGTMDTDNVFRAKQLLAKHDENYMPPEIAKTLKHEKQAP